MGATAWKHLAEWNAEPAAALRQLQAKFLEENYDLPSLLRDFLASARHSVQIVKDEGDEYGLRDIYEDDVKKAEAFVAQPLPSQPQERISILRSLFESGGEGIGNVLDVTDVSDEGGLFVTRPLKPTDVRELFGTSSPTLEEADRGVNSLYLRLGRAESVCFPVYDESAQKPVGWYFVGYSAD